MLKIVMFGAGNALHEILDADFCAEHDVVGIVDNDISKHGRRISCGITQVEISSVNRLREMDFDRIYISVYLYEIVHEISLQLQSLGVPLGKIFSRSNGVWIRVPEIRKWPSNLPSNQRLFYDTSQIAVSDIGTGIQRIVNNLFVYLRRYYDGNLFSFRALKDRCVTTREYQCRSEECAYDNIEYEFVFHESDKIFMTDASWISSPKILTRAEKNRAETTVIVYDLLPLNREWFPKSLSEEFEDWILSVLQKTDKIICISHKVADDVTKFYKDKGLIRTKPLKVFVSAHWGANLPASPCTPRREIEEFLKMKKTFLIVGNVDIRKNQLLAVQAFREIFSSEEKPDIQLLILGRKAYKHQEVSDFLLETSYLEGRVRWIYDATDGELQWSYQNATALLFLSQDEGFGLPLVEAAYHRLPILCSDIPIFHEVAGDGATYVDISTVDSVAKSIIDWLHQDVHPDSGTVPIYRWEQTAKEIADILENKKEPYSIL